MEKEEHQAVKQRGIYLLPNFLTTASLFAGFYAIIASMKGHFNSAAIAIFVAMIADALDGRVARLMRANTEFGVQYDSLADLVSFGMAPAVLIYSWALMGLGKIGWLAAFIYVASVALRLARFNVQVETTDKRYFVGLPCPMGAATLAAFVWLLNDFVNIQLAVSIVAILLTIVVACLMVTNVRYRSFKEFEFRGRFPYFSLPIVIIVMVAISINPPTVLFLVAMCYLISGPLMSLYFMRKQQQESSSRTGNKKSH